MTKLTVHLHTQNEEALKQFVKSMRTSGWIYVSHTFPTATGTRFVRFIKGVSK